MDLRIVGSGVGRTGTTSLKAALEQLLGGRCYHMIECFAHPEHPPHWLDGLRGGEVDWDAVLGDYVATVDWPAAACWERLAEECPDALILHSERPADAWYTSADNTILEMFKPMGDERPPPGENPWLDMALEMFERFCDDILDRGTAMAAFERWNAHVRTTAPPDRLVIWHPGDGWEPLCEALGVPVPEEPFPHANTTEDFRSMSGLE